jgi:hypothetical protein
VVDPWVPIHGVAPVPDADGRWRAFAPATHDALERTIGWFDSGAQAAREFDRSAVGLRLPPNLPRDDAHTWRDRMDEVELERARQEEGVTDADVDSELDNTYELLYFLDNPYLMVTTRPADEPLARVRCGALGERDMTPPRRVPPRADGLAPSTQSIAQAATVSSPPDPPLGVHPGAETGEREDARPTASVWIHLPDG